MAHAIDVAKHILAKKGPMSAMKLQKLVYYSKAWHLVWDEESLFPDRIEAWANGPVVCNLYAQHRGLFDVNASVFACGDLNNLTQSQRESIDIVLNFYGQYSAHQLSELTHREAPWRDARSGIAPGERGSASISDSAMAEFYDGLTHAQA